MEGMNASGYIEADGDDQFILSPAGRRFLADFGARAPRSSSAGYHQDTSESGRHLSGDLGRVILERLTELGWVVRHSNARTVTITNAGRKGLLELLDIDDL